MKESVFTVVPIGVIHSPFNDAPGTPIQASMAEGAEGIVEVFDKFAEGLADLDEFERLWLLYWFDRANTPHLKVTPFRDSEQRGLFATRAPCRPNPIGISPVELVKIEGNRLHVRDIDVLDGTPLIDIKPYVRQFDVFHVTRCGWLDSGRSGQTKADSRFIRREREDK